MKKSINKNIILIFVLTLFLYNCQKEDNNTGDSTLEVATGVQGTVNFVAPLLSTQTVREADGAKFTFNVTISKPQSKDIYVKVLQTGGTADEDDATFSHVVIISAYQTTGKGTIEILNDNLEETTETLMLQIGDNTTANATLSQRNISISIKDCFSDLAGTYTYVTTNCYTPGPPPGNAAGPFTGSVTLTQTSVGVYNLSDASFGGWLGLYGPQTPATNNTANGVKITHTCGQLAFAGVDQYNEVFTFSNLVISGSNMSFKWTNDFGEYGSTVLTRTDGTSWPALTL